MSNDEKHAPPAQNALRAQSDEIMSMLHAQQLRQESMPSATVTQWLQELYDLAQVGLGKPRHFRRDDPERAARGP